MSGRRHKRLAWEGAFFDALASHGIMTRAAKDAGRTSGAVYSRLKASPDFAQRYEQTLLEFNNRDTAPDNDNGAVAVPLQWQATFLAALAETSCVAKSADRANISTREVYKLRRDDNEFAAKWQTALAEGYANLEMEVLGHLRDPQPGRKLDVANALRLLAAHRESYAKEQAVRRNVSVAEVRASIERKVQALRETVAADEARKKASAQV